MNQVRNVLSILFLAVLCMAAAGAAEREEKVVYHISDNANQAGPLRNIRNHLEASPKAKIVVVTYGYGIDFLLDGAKDKNGEPFSAQVQELAARGVQFRVCNNTLNGRKIDKSSVIPQATVVPSGIAEISRLQFQEGYAYIKP